MIAAYIRRLPPTQALLGIVIGAISLNNWRHLSAIFGQGGPPHPLTVLTLAQLHAAARGNNPGLRLAPVGGFAGSGRLALGKLSSLLILFCEFGSKSHLGRSVLVAEARRNQARLNLGYHQITHV